MSSLAAVTAIIISAAVENATALVYHSKAKTYSVQPTILLSSWEYTLITCALTTILHTTYCYIMPSLAHLSHFDFKGKALNTSGSTLLGMVCLSALRGLLALFFNILITSGIRFLSFVSVLRKL
uniref:Uncharacterized protein n=1 Tax=Glossina pallidipes TaxID=7398 RepID=A0A1A9ZPD1_GLOPL